MKFYLDVDGGDSTKKIQRVEQHNIKLDSEFGKFIDEYCFKSKNLYNYANYIIRQEFINNDRWIKYNELFQLVKDSEHTKILEVIQDKELYEYLIRTGNHSL